MLPRTWEFEHRCFVTFIGMTFTANGGQRLTALVGAVFGAAVAYLISRPYERRNAQQP